MKNKGRSERRQTPVVSNGLCPSGEMRFYRSNEKPYGAFSNLFKRPVVFEGREYPTAEHAYQAGKPRDPKVRQWMLNAPNARLVAIVAHNLFQWDVVPNWSKIKVERMRQVLYAKFIQHNDLRELLLSTGDAQLIESGRVSNRVNRYWGVVNGKGKNILGILLMELRTKLRPSSSDAVQNSSLFLPLDQPSAHLTTP